MIGRVQALSRRVHVLSGRSALAGFPTRLALRGRDVMDLRHQLHSQMQTRRSMLDRRLSQLTRRLETFDLGRRRAGIGARLAAADARMHTAAVRRVDRSGARFRASAGRLDTLSPLAVLGRGYAVAWNADRTRALREASEVSPGDRIRVTLSSGELDCDVRSNE